MADNSKKGKIAAAKKKLKQFQQRSGRTPSRSPTRSPHPPLISVDDMTDDHIQAHKPHHSISPVSEESKNTQNSRGRPISRGSENPSAQTDIRPTASTESLQQLSRQLNGLLAESVDFISGREETGNSSVEDLEKRNRDLAALLEKHSQAIEQLNTQNHQLRDHSKNLQDQLESERNSFQDKYRKDVASLKEQLQVHIQTIGILVAEKTELQSQVGQSQRIADQRLEEIEELSGRLKASRQRVADLERSLSTSSQSGQQLEKINKENAKDIDRLKLELYKSNKSVEESHQQISELTGKLQSKASESEVLEQTVEDLKRRLEMAEIYAQQLSSESEGYVGSMKMLTDIQSEKDSLHLKLQQMEETIQTERQEKDQIRDHYQQNVEQLTQQIQQLIQQVMSLSEEREQLLAKKQELEKAVLELQAKLEDVHGQQSAQKDNIPDHAAQSHLIADLEQLRADLHDVQLRHEAQIRDNAQLSRFLEEREATILELEHQVEQMGSDVGDRTQLLESIQSDRTALSRALSQNRELKSQLAELQNGFVKMSNDNMDLVTQLQTAEHLSNDLAARLGQQEDELKVVREALSKKEHDMQVAKEEAQQARRQQYQQDQIQDRLRHYEAQAQLVETLQNELTAAQDMMEALTTQNSELRAMLIKATEVKKHKNNDNGSEDGTSLQHDDLIGNLTATIKQLEQERGQLYENLKEQRHLSDTLSVKIADLQEDVIRKSEDYVDSDRISRSEYEQLKTSMELIQEKYMRVMRDKAELSDKADQLEHLVVQLQGETDTIGEYISLYHHQRALLQQRELHKNDYIAQLARDREQMQDKLGELQALVMQLLGERNMLHSYHEEGGGKSIQQTNGHSHHHSHHATHDSTIQPHLDGHKKQALTNGPIANSYDWPDYTSSESDTESEVEPIVGGAELPPSPTSSVSTPPTLLAESLDGQASVKQVHGHTHHGRHPPHSVASHASSTSHPSGFAVQEEDETAHRILNLLSEIGHSNMVDKLPFTERNFLPCKYCKGAVQIV